MIKVEIKNKATEIITHGATFDTQELANAWIDSQVAKGSACPFGRPAWTEKIEIGKDKNGEPTYKTVEHQDQFEVIMSDITSSYQMELGKAQYAAAKNFGNNLVAEFTIENSMMGITTSKSEVVINKLAFVLTALQNGYLETAVLRTKAIDSALYDDKYVTATRLLSYVNKIEAYLGMPLSDNL